MSWFLNNFKGLSPIRVSQFLNINIGLKRPLLLFVVMAAACSGESGQTGLEQSEFTSTPLELPFAQQFTTSTALESTPTKIVPLSHTGPLVTVGLNFQGSQLYVDTGFIPPDTMGAVGPDHIVEIINGRFDVYDKTTGNEVFTRSLNGFWTNVVGLTIAPRPTPDDPPNFTFDPRIVFDLASGRWFAASLDRHYGAGNNIYLARSDTDDPTGDWDGVRFAADTVGVAEFHDYDTLAVDADGLYICTNDFGGGNNESCYSIPKADLLLATPSIANMTRFEATPAGLPAVVGSIQPALDFGPTDGRAPLLGVAGGALVRSDILGAGGAGATLGTITAIVGDPGHAAPPPARQPHPNDPNVTLENVAPRLVANVFKQGDSLWAVHAVRGNSNNSAVRWYEIDEATNTMLQTGLIEDPEQDFHEPSIAVNEFGNVVVGYTCSGPDLAPSACASVGETVGGVTTFEVPMILAAGAGHYYQDFGTNRNRWGDYSATVIDPADPCTLWTFQELVAVSAVGDVGPSPRPAGGQWGIQISQLTFNTCGADVAILSFNAVNPPGEILVGQGVPITLRKEITNNGPFAPVDTELTVTATPPADSIVTPNVATLSEPALGLGEVRVVEENFTINCGQASQHSFTFTNEIEPVGINDPDPSNNQASANVDVECVVPVVINIKPGSDPNSIQPAKGTIAVAILTTSTGEGGTPLAFDATTIDPLSVRFGPRDVVFAETGGAFEQHSRGHIEDAFELDEVTQDGDLDMVLHFKAIDTGIQATDTEACVKGQFSDVTGTHKFFGCDAIRIVPAAK